MPSLLRGPGRSELRPPAHRRIVSITDNGGGFCLVTTAAPHGLVGETVVVSGSSVAAYNTTHPLSDVSDRTFTTDVSYTADATGGTWRFAA